MPSTDDDEFYKLATNLNNTVTYVSSIYNPISLF